MTPEGQIAALLHVSAVVSVLSLAFLGLDRSHIEPPNYKEGPVKARATAKRVLARLDFNRARLVSLFGKREMPISQIFAIAIICLIAWEPLSLDRPLSVAHACVRQRKIPLLVYLTKYNHTAVVGCIALFSNAVLFSSATALLFGFEFPLIVSAILLLFLCIGLIWMVITGAAMRKLEARRLEKICRGLGIWVNREITRRLKLQQEEDQRRITTTIEHLEMMRQFFQERIDETNRQLASLKAPNGSNIEPPKTGPMMSA